MRVLHGNDGEGMKHREPCVPISRAIRPRAVFQPFGAARRGEARAKLPPCSQCSQFHVSLSLSLVIGWGSLDRFCMSTDQRWKWAGIVSVVSVGGVLITDIVANVVGGYISDRIKTWDVPQHAPRRQEARLRDRDGFEHPASGKRGQVTMAAVAPKPASAPMPEIDIGEPTPPAGAPRQQPRQSQCRCHHQRSQPAVLSGTVEQVIDTATLQIQGETIELAGIKGSARPIAISLRNSSRSRARKSAASR